MVLTARVECTVQCASIVTMKKIDGRRKITPAQHEEIVRRHHQGEGASALAQEFGLARGTVAAMSQAALAGRQVLTRVQVRRVQVKLGIESNLRRVKQPPPAGKTAPGRRFKLTPQHRADVIRRHAEGEKMTKLAGEYGVTRQGIAAIINRTTKRKVRGALHKLEFKHIKWLKSKLTDKGVPTGKLWPKDEVRAMLHKKYGVHFNLRSFHSHLRWMGVEIGKKPNPQSHKAAMKKRAKTLKREAAEVMAAIKAGQVEMPYRSLYAKGITRRGRPPKQKPSPKPKGGRG